MPIAPSQSINAIQEGLRTMLERTNCSTVSATLRFSSSVKSGAIFSNKGIRLDKESLALRTFKKDQLKVTHDTCTFTSSDSEGTRAVKEKKFSRGAHPLWAENGFRPREFCLGKLFVTKKRSRYLTQVSEKVNKMFRRSGEVETEKQNERIKRWLTVHLASRTQ